MKTTVILIFSVLVLSQELLFAQSAHKRNILRVESGYSFTGLGDISGYCVYNEYSRIFGEKIKISSAIGVMNFFDEDYDNSYNNLVLLQNANCKTLEFTGYYYPLKLNRFILETGVGCLYRNWHWIFMTGPDQSYSVMGLNIDPSSYANKFINSLGYTISTGTIIEISSIIALNLRCVYQNDLAGINTIMGRVGLNLKF
jgi:hypothetical protein